LCLVFILLFINKLQIFKALGNERPLSLVRVEDCVLDGIVAISEGKPRLEVMETLHSQISLLIKDLADDDVALSWFNLSSPPQSELPSTPSAREFIYLIPSFV
jgi:hypothetical protein